MSQGRHTKDASFGVTYRTRWGRQNVFHGRPQEVILPSGNVVYNSKCPSDGCHKSYIGEANRRIVETIQDYNNRDKSFHLLNHTREKGHTRV